MSSTLTLDQLTKKCDVCGHEFGQWRIESYTYKRHFGNRWYFFCGYGCMRKFEKMHPGIYSIRNKNKINKELAGIVNGGN